jgi:multidrug resistance efflux pump
MSAYSSEIKEMNIQNGVLVEAGDVLFTVQSTDLDLQKIQVDAKIEIYKKQIDQLQKLEKSIKDNMNYFDGGNSEDAQYYNQFEAYKSQVAQNKVDVSIDDSRLV